MFFYNPGNSHIRLILALGNGNIPRLSPGNLVIRQSFYKDLPVGRHDFTLVSGRFTRPVDGTAPPLLGINSHQVLGLVQIFEIQEGGKWLRMSLRKGSRRRKVKGKVL